LHKLCRAPIDGKAGRAWFGLLCGTPRGALQRRATLTRFTFSKKKEKKRKIDPRLNVEIEAAHGGN